MIPADVTREGSAAQVFVSFDVGPAGARTTLATLAVIAAAVILTLLPVAVAVGLVTLPAAVPASIA